MRSRYADELRSAATIAAACCLIAAGLVSLTGTGAAGDVPAAGVSVNRALKGDRLPSAATPKRSAARAPAAGVFPASPEHAPVGCDRAFSPIADPARANIYKRCTA